MTDVITIPLNDDGKSVWADYPVVGKPCWYKVTRNGAPAKPLIRCNCGSVSGIGLHTVHADGRVMNSFYHKRGIVYPDDSKGCEWHVFLQLAGWDGGEIGPD